MNWCRAHRHNVGAALAIRGLLVSVALAMGCSWGFAQTQEQEVAGTEAKAPPLGPGKESPWIIAPVFNANPKLGFALGALGGYIHYFDEKSRPSIFALTGQYTSTDSIIAALMARTSFDQDGQRLLAGLAYGNIKNDYGDYLGTGVPLQSNTELRSFLSRYTYRVGGDWFVGVQGIYQNFDIGGETPFDDAFLDFVGVQPYKSGGAGLVGQYDSRDNENMPTQGSSLNLNNVSYREWLGGQANFDMIRGDFRFYFGHGDGNVFAVRQLNHMTHNAPTQVRAPVQLRGYKIGQYNGLYMSSIEGEERWRFAERWTSTFFVGVACTYGGDQSCSDSKNLYPAAGAGVQYILKPKEGIVLNLEYALGKDGNYGIYLKMGYAY
jgi:hypothetical protein